MPIYTTKCHSHPHCITCDKLNLKFLSARGIHINSAEKIASPTTVKVSLTAIRTLCLCIENLGIPLSSEQIICHSWRNNCVGKSSLPVLINEVRKVITSAELKLINIRSFGYMLVDTQYKQNECKQKNKNNLKKYIKTKKITKQKIKLIAKLTDDDINEIFK